MAGDAFSLPQHGNYPWIEAEYAYAGWVPNVAGHLSFNLIDTLAREPTYNHQHDLSSPRTVALRRRRLAQDFPFPNRLMRWLRPSAVQDFVVLAESTRVTTPHLYDEVLSEADDANGALIGLVAVFPSEEDPESKRDRKSLLRSIDSAILKAATEKATCGADPSARLARDILRMLESRPSQVACHLLHFAMFRTGELRIWFDLAEIAGRDLLKEPASDLDRQAADHIAPQVYYCLKDLLHAHYHHDPHSDQMLPLSATETRASKPVHEKSEVAWRYATLRGLARLVVELRHGRSPKGHQQAKGIIAYAQAFQQLLARVRRPKAIGQPHAQETRIIPYDFANLIMSLEAVDASAQSSISARLQLFAILIGIVLSGLALWAGAVQIQPILCASLATAAACPKIGPGAIVSLINTVVANPTAFLIILFTSGLITFVTWFNGTNALPSVERTIRWLRRFSEALGVQVSRWLKGSDWIGWGASLFLLGALAGGLGGFAYYLAPKTSVPAIDVEPDDKRSPWSSLYGMAGERVDQSGLVVRSVVAPELRTLMGEEYSAFLKLLSPQSTLVQDGGLLVVTSAAAPGDDGAFLVIDPKGLRLEAGLRRDGLLSVHRTPGAMLDRPEAVRDFLGRATQGDAGPIPVETSTCDLAPGGTAGRTIHLSGAFRAELFCEYDIDLHRGQILSFDRKQAKGLQVLIVNRKRVWPVGEGYTAPNAGKQRIRVIWEGWSPTGAAKLRPRRFYVRLTVH